MTGSDVIVIGGGVAGASLAWRLSERARVTLLEAEAVPGYHSSGRSATYFNSGLGRPAVRALAACSENFFRFPPAGFVAGPLVHELPALTVTSAKHAAELAVHARELRALVPEARLVDAGEIAELVPGVRPDPEGIWTGLLDPRAFRLEGHALLLGYLDGARARGARIVTRAAVTRIRRQSGSWHADAGERFSAPVLVNAAGAWGDRVAALAGVRPLGLQPLRRTIAIVEVPAADTSRWPFVRSFDDLFYFTGESGGVLLSPADETPVEPHDVQADDLDVAIAVDRFENVTGLSVRRVRTNWAGLRSFVPDRLPAVGFDPEAPGFFWYVGQGGVGLQTSPALSSVGVALLDRHALPETLSAAGIDPSRFDPARCRAACTSGVAAGADS